MLNRMPPSDDVARLATPPVCASADGVTPFPWTDLAIIVVLVVINGVFAMSELAIVSAKTSTLEAKAEAGSKSARTAIALAANPGKFLSTVQIGITLIGIVNGAYSGASLGGPVGERLASYEKQVADLEAKRTDAFGQLSGLIQSMRDGQEQVRREAQRLGNSLTNAPKARGRWGEQQLKNVLESCGLSEHVDFDTLLKSI
mgnify:CR=1 FL=1